MSYCDIYQGKSDHTQHALAHTGVVACLEVAELSGQGYYVDMDKLLSSPELFTNLFYNYDTAAC